MNNKPVWLETVIYEPFFDRIEVGIVNRASKNLRNWSKVSEN